MKQERFFYPYSNIQGFRSFDAATAYKSAEKKKFNDWKREFVRIVNSASNVNEIV